MREQEKTRNLEADCSNIEEQLGILEANFRMWERKIVEAQSAVMQQESTIPMLLSKK